MKLTEKALRCQELGADKTLSLGCTIETKKRSSNTEIEIFIALCEDNDDNCYIEHIYKKVSGSFGFEGIDSTYTNRFGLEKKIIGHPLTRGRLCYLLYSRVGRTEKDERLHLHTYFLLNTELYNQTIIERQHNDEFMDLVLEFLESVK